MECKECGMEAMILERSKLLFEDDDTAEKETKAYYIQKYGCRNPHCRNHREKVSLGEKKVYID